MYRSFMMIGLGLCVVGCSTLSDNPREGGFLGGVMGIESGAYDRRIEERQRNLDALNQAQRQEAGLQSGLLAEKTEAKSALEQLRRQSDGLNREISALNKKISAQKVSTQAAQQKKQALAQKAKALRADSTQLKKALAQSAPNDVGKLQAEEQRLRTEIKQLEQDMALSLD